METITVEQLLGNVGNLAFTHEDLILMLSSSDDSNEDFKIVHREDLFVVPIQSIREFFQDHPKPKRKMGKDEELEFLRKKVATMESREQPKAFAEPKKEPPATKSFGEDWRPKIPISGEAVPEPGVAPGADRRPATTSPGRDDEPLIPEKESLPHERDKRETVEEIQARLGTELRGKVPDNVKRQGRPAKGVIKAKLEIPTKG